MKENLFYYAQKVLYSLLTKGMKIVLFITLKNENSNNTKNDEEISYIIDL